MHIWIFCVHTLFWLNDKFTLKFTHDMAVILNYTDHMNNLSWVCMYVCMFKRDGIMNALLHAFCSIKCVWCGWTVYTLWLVTVSTAFLLSRQSNEKWWNSIVWEFHSRKKTEIPWRPKIRMRNERCYLIWILTKHLFFHLKARTLFSTLSFHLWLRKNSLQQLITHSLSLFRTIFAKWCKCIYLLTKISKWKWLQTLAIWYHKLCIVSYRIRTAHTERERLSMKINRQWNENWIIISSA